MPRQPRVFMEGMPCHVIQRGNNRQACFFDVSDYEFYLECLQEGSDKYGCDVHAYVLMTNHVHLLVTSETRDSLSKLMQSVGRRYVKWINTVYRRSGTLWEGRYKSSLVDSARYVLACYRYIEMNPMRARMVDGPEQYCWSSHRENIGKTEIRWLTAHAELLSLGVVEEARHQAYRELFKRVDSAESHWITERTLSDLPIGSEKFREQIEETLGIRFNRAVVGRPKAG